MNELLDWFGIAAGCVLLAAMLVAGWEHLRREAFEALRQHSPEGRRPPHPGLFKVAAVDVALDTAVDASSDANPDANPNPNPSHAAMALALSRAAGARQRRDGSPWLDTCPQITVSLDMAAGAGADLRGLPEEKPTDVPAAYEPEPSTLPLPQQTTIERAALR